MDKFYDKTPKTDSEKPKNYDAPLRDRGHLLTLFLGLIMGLNTLALLALCVRIVQVVYYTRMRYTDIDVVLGDRYLITLPAISAAFIFECLVIACAVAVWKWQKWGYYSLIIACVIQAVLMLITGNILGMGIVIVGLIILVALVQSRIILFEKTSYENTLPDRGMLLTLLLVFNVSFYTVGLIILSVQTFFALRANPARFLAYFDLAVGFAFTCAMIICAVGVWKWKKWGYYGLTAVYVVQIISRLFSGDMAGFFIAMIQAAFLLAAIRSQIEMFD